MIIDCHNHVLATAEPPGHERFIREMRAPGLRSIGALPTDRPPTEADWDSLDVDVARPVDPSWLIAQHAAAGVDRSVVLAVAPSDYTAYGRRGTVDLAGVTEVPPHIEHGNDAIAALVAANPELLGMAAVNPRFGGLDAPAELTRAVGELGLTGLKLYPMYDQYAIDDLDVTGATLETASDLGIGVMIHMGTSSAVDAPLSLGDPTAVDAVARSFPDLPILICHAGFPWVEECLVVASRHHNVYLDISYFLGRITRAEFADFLRQAEIAGCPTSRICWGTDFPGGGHPRVLLPKVALFDEDPSIGRTLGADVIAGFLALNWARFAGLEIEREDVMATMEERHGLWQSLEHDAAGALR